MCNCFDAADVFFRSVSDADLSHPAGPLYRSNRKLVVLPAYSFLSVADLAIKTLLRGEITTTSMEFVIAQVRLDSPHSTLLVFLYLLDIHFVPYVDE